MKKLTKLLSLSLFLSASASASIATIGSYTFNSSLDNSSGSAADLTAVGVSPTYSNTVIFGQTQNYAMLDASAGLTVDPSNSWLTSPSSSYSVVMDVRVPSQTAASGYTALFHARTDNDSGLYFYQNTIVLYEGAIRIQAVLDTPGDWMRVAMTKTGNSSVSIYYGTPGDMVEAGSWSSNIANFDVYDSTRFLLDDGSENAPSDISYLALYDQALTATQLDAIPVPEPANFALSLALIMTGVAVARRRQ